MVARNKLVISGNLVQGEERWSITTNWGIGTTLVTQGNLQTWVNQVGVNLASAWAGALDPLAGMLSTGGTIDTIDAYYYTGPGAASAQAQNSLGVPLSGDTDPRNPSFTAMCVTLRTARNGASGRGRFFFPALGNQLTAASRFGGSTGGATAAGAFRALLVQCQSAAGQGETFQPAVYSPTLEVLTAVNSISVGNVPDTQRRRKDTLEETYASVTYPT